MSELPKSLFGKVIKEQPDPILKLIFAFIDDKNPKKVNCGVGSYKDEEGKPVVFKTVRKVEELMSEKEFVTKHYWGDKPESVKPKDGLMDKSYPGELGYPLFHQQAARMMFGDNSKAMKEGRVTSCQSIAGTGACRLGFELFYRTMRSSKIYGSDPSWVNHNGLYKHVYRSDVNMPEYRYRRAGTEDLDFEGMMEDIENMEEKSVILLQMCGHNPTGIDPTESQWEKIIRLIGKKKIIPFFDCAYQGFVTGDFDKDAYPVRLCEKLGVEVVCAQSFSKNMGLYGERIGCFHALFHTKANAEGCYTQMKWIVRRLYSFPPVHCARAAAFLMKDDQLRNEWMKELADAVGRLNRMRKLLYEALIKFKVKGTWDHVMNQRGMFVFTGMSENQVNNMISKYHIYMIPMNGRLCLCGVQEKNVEYVAHAIKDTIENVPREKKVETATTSTSPGSK